MLAKGWIATRLRRLPSRYVETTISSVRNGVFLLKEQRLGFKPKQAVVTNYISTSYSTKKKKKKKKKSRSYSSHTHQPGDRKGDRDGDEGRK